MAIKKAVVEVDIKSQSVKIAGEETMKLAQVVRILQKELEQTQKGTAQFELLSAKLNETKDRISAVKAQSSELFGTFSMLPGPIGDIGSAADGALSTLKTFSTFSFKDIGIQFKGLFKDVGEVASNISKATGITKLFNTTTNLLAKGLNSVGVSANASSKGLKIFSGALVATGIGALVVALGMLITNFDKVRDALYKMIPGLKSVGDAIGNMINFFTDLVGITSEAERAEAKRQATYAKAAAGTKIINEGIQRQIDLLKAQGASQDQIDAKRKEMIKNEMNDLKKAANERGVLYGEQAKKYKDLQNDLAVIDAEATKRNQDETDKKNKERQQKADAANQKALAADKQYRQEQADAAVQLAKNEEDTQENILREALKKQYAIKNEGKKISVEVAKLQAQEIEQIVKEEVQKDKEARQKAFTERLQGQKEISKQELDTLTETYEAKKIKYGEDSKEAREAQDQVFAKTAENLLKEKNALLEQQKTKDGITAEEVKRLGEIAVEEQKLTNTKDKELQTRATNDKNARDKELEKQREQIDKELALLQMKTQYESDNRKEYYDNRLAELEKQQEKELFGVEKGSELELAILRKYAGLKKDLKEEEQRANLQDISATIDTFATLGNALASTYDEEAKTSKDAFEKRKKLQIATAQMAGAAGIINILSAPSTLSSPFDYIVKAANVAALLISTGANISKIRQTQFESSGSGNEVPRKLASGGIVTGPGGGKSDMVPAMLSNGESVINSVSTSMFRPLLSTINQIGGGRKFASGGIVSTNQSQMQAINSISENITMGSTPIKTYVVAQDMTNVQAFDRAQKSRSTL